MESSAQQLSFKKYSKVYDFLPRYSYPYQELQSIVKALIARISFGGASLKCIDIGGGTGNFTKLLVQDNPWTIDLLEPDRGMMAIARMKMKRESVRFIEKKLEDLDTQCEYDLVMCMHALYLMPSPDEALAKMIDLLKPGGYLILCDIGKPLNILDWTFYYGWSLLYKYGFFKTIYLFYNYRAFLWANVKIFWHQLFTNWRHTVSDLEKKLPQTMNVIQSEACFRGYSNLILARKIQS